MQYVDSCVCRLRTLRKEWLMWLDAKKMFINEDFVFGTHFLMGATQIKLNLITHDQKPGAGSTTAGHSTRS